MLRWGMCVKSLELAYSVKGKPLVGTTAPCAMLSRVPHVRQPQTLLNLSARKKEQRNESAAWSSPRAGLRQAPMTA